MAKALPIRLTQVHYSCHLYADARNMIQLVSCFCFQTSSCVEMAVVTCVVGDCTCFLFCYTSCEDISKLEVYSGVR